jgi:hypothetical protein
VLSLIHRVLPRLDEVERLDGVQAALQQALEELGAARAAHQKWGAALRPAIDGETVALVAAAVAMVLGRPHRLLGVQPVTPVVSWVNAWVMEGRFQHYSSHKIR